mgnify:FL=1
MIEDLQTLLREVDISSLRDHQTSENATHLTHERSGKFMSSRWVGWSIVTGEAVCGGTSYDDVKMQLTQRSEQIRSAKNSDQNYLYFYTITGPYTAEA